jgi:hypothetical protein
MNERGGVGRVITLLDDVSETVLLYGIFPHSNNSFNPLIELYTAVWHNTFSREKERAGPTIVN